MQNTKGKVWNSTEKSGEEYVTVKFELMLVEMRRTMGLSESSISALSRTSLKGTKQERSVADNQVSSPPENAQCNNSLKLEEDTYSSITL